MVNLRKITRNVFYILVVGLIAEVLSREILERAFVFSWILGIIFVICLVIYHLASYFDLVSNIKDFIEEISEEISEFFEDLLERVGIF